MDSWRMRDRFVRRKARSAGRALWLPILGGLAVALSLTSCDDVRLLRPSVLKQLVLLQQKAGTARLRLDAPGLYTLACPVGNHAGRGELGVIIVRGDTPASARLDRPPQLRPGR